VSFLRRWTWLVGLQYSPGSLERFVNCGKGCWVIKARYVRAHDDLPRTTREAEFTKRKTLRDRHRFGDGPYAVVPRSRLPFNHARSARRFSLTSRQGVSTGGVELMNMWISSLCFEVPVLE